MTNSYCRSVVVLGMHRSGTSVLSRALIALGVDFGSGLMSGKQDNPKGHFEDEEAYSINEAFLGETGCRWHSLLLPRTYPDERLEAYRNRVHQLIKDKYSGLSLWGLKEPRITRLLPLWEAAMREQGIAPIYILANRNPLSVAASLHNRNDMPRAQALALWALHQMDGLRAVIRHGGLVVDYDALMSQPRLELERIGRFLGVGLLEREAEVASFVNDFLEQGLRHSHYEARTGSDTGIESICLSFHDDLLKLARTNCALQEKELTLAENLLMRIEHELSSYQDWFSAIDTLYAQMEAQAAEHRNQVQVRNLAVAKLRSQLAWLEGKGPIRFIRRLKDILPRSS